MLRWSLAPISPNLPPLPPYRSRQPNADSTKPICDTTPRYAREHPFPDTLPPIWHAPLPLSPSRYRSQPHFRATRNTDLTSYPYSPQGTPPPRPPPETKTDPRLVSNTSKTNARHLYSFRPHSIKRTWKKVKLPHTPPLVPHTLRR